MAIRGAPQIRPALWKEVQGFRELARHLFHISWHITDRDICRGNRIILIFLTTKSFLLAIVKTQWCKLSRITFQVNTLTFQLVYAFCSCLTIEIPQTTRRKLIASTSTMNNTVLFDSTSKYTYFKRSFLRLIKKTVIV